MTAVTKTIETVRIKNNTLELSVFCATGKDGKYFVSICPSIVVSGYGDTPEESKKNLEENIHLFCEDLMNLPQKKRELEILKLGFKKAKIRNKNFSKTYIDENGDLKGFEPGSVTTEMLEEKIAC